MGTEFVARTAERSYWGDLFLVRKNVLNTCLGRGYKISLLNTLKLLPELEYRRKYDVLTPDELGFYEKSCEDYRYALKLLMEYCIEKMYIERATLDLSPLFRFIFGGNVCDNGKYADHITNKVYKRLFTALEVKGNYEENVSNRVLVSKEELVSANNFEKVDIKQCERDYWNTKRFPRHLYILLAAAFNVNVLPNDPATYFVERNQIINKYYLYIDVYGDRTTIYPLQIIEKSIYSEVFFSVYLQDRTEQLKENMDNIEESRIGRKEGIRLNDPSDRKKNKSGFHSKG